LTVLLIFVGIITGIVSRHWLWIDGYLIQRTSDTTRQLAVAIGAAITGLVAIVFSLTLFTVQQAAQKGTASIYEEFSRDAWLWVIYGAFGLFAISCFFLALLPMGHNFVTVVLPAKTGQPT
jgi:uncharacterized membrane protein